MTAPIVRDSLVEMPTGYCLCYDGQIGYWWYHPATLTVGKAHSNKYAALYCARVHNAKGKDPVAECLDRKAQHAARRALMQATSYQDCLLLIQGFVVDRRTKASGRVCRYHQAVGTGGFAIHSTRGGKWNLRKIVAYLPAHAGGFPIYAEVSHKRFDTPLAVALWFNLARNYL